MPTSLDAMTSPLDVSPGRKAWCSQSFTTKHGRSFQVSVGVIRGVRPGRCLAHIAGQHGMEHTGPLLLRQMFDEIDPAQVSGTLLLCPCANPLALELNFEVYPEALGPRGDGPITYEALGVKRREDLGIDNMNRVWSDDIACQGDADASVVQRVARWLWRTAIAPAEWVVDHHSVTRALAPYVFVEEPSVPWAPVLGLPAVWCTGPMKPDPTPYPWQRLAYQSIRHGKVGLVIEYTHQHVVHEPDLALGRFAVLNTMRALGLIEGQATVPRDVWLLPGPYWEHVEDLTASAAGHVHLHVEEYQWLSVGQPIATVIDLQTQQVGQTLTAPADGLMLHRQNLPVVQPGDMICRLSRDARRLARAGDPFVPPGV